MEEKLEEKVIEKWDTRKVFNIIFDWDEKGIMSATMIQIGGINTLMRSLNREEAAALLKMLTLKTLY